MNPFNQIIDLTGPNGVEPGKTGLNQLGATNSKKPGIDFLQILSGKLSGELPFLFGGESESIGLDAGVVSEEITPDKLAESLLSNLPGEPANEKLGENENQNGLIEPIKIGSEWFLKITTAEAVNNIQNSSNIDTALPPEHNFKVEDLNVAPNRSGLFPGLKIDNLNLNNINLVTTQIDKNNPDAEIKPVVQAEIDKELTPKSNTDLKTASLIDKVIGSLNVKSVKLERNIENNQAEKDPVKLALPTKSYIKVSAIESNSNSNANNDQFAETKQNLFSGNTEIIPSESKAGDSEKVRLNNFEAVARVELDQKPVGKIEAGQSPIQTKPISDIASTLANNVEKIELPETKIATAPVKFVLPAEINGKNIRNNHTVMIRMEPDHLGPVRMTISTYNDVLTARLVVDSPVAKAAVESNLNNLLEQLNRQGIKVDTFEVSVNGGEVGHEAKENRFAGSAGIERQYQKSYEKSNAIDEVVAQRAQEHLYIEANGVNCFA